MARSSACTEQYAHKVFDRGDIVRDAIYRQSRQVSLVLEASFAAKITAWPCSKSSDYETRLEPR